MKNILAENLLRFRAKNLSESDVSRLIEQDPDSRGGDENIGDPGVQGSGYRDVDVSTPSERGETKVKTDKDGRLILPAYKPGGLAGQTLWIDPARYRSDSKKVPSLAQYGKAFQTPIKAALSQGDVIYIWNDRNPEFNKKVLNQLYLGVDINEYKQKGGVLQGLESADTRGGSENIQYINNKYRLGDVMFASPGGQFGRKTLLPAYRSAASGKYLKPRKAPWYTVTIEVASPEWTNTTEDAKKAVVHYQGVGNIGFTDRSIMNAYKGEESLGKTMSGFNIIEDPAGDAAIQNVLAGKDPLGRDFSNKNKNKDQQQHWANIKNIILKGVA